MASGVLGLLKIILDKKNENHDEKSNALVCIWNLCFDENICEIIQQDNKDLVNSIIEIKNHSPFEDLERRSSGILFTLNDFTKNKDKITEKSSQNKKHIMISYNSGSRDICIKLKDELKVFILKSGI
jgi:hypothetical protein